MKEDIANVEFHQDLFHAGKNFGKKVDIKMVSGLSISFDSDLRRFEVIYNGRMRILPELSAFSWELATAKPIPVIENKHHTEDKRKRATAQVSTPHGHVFAGEGAGVVRDR